jgi:hypothetical protein
MIRAGVVATVAALALAACAGHGVVPSTTSGGAPMVSGFGNTSPLALKTCDTSPPQYEWIFKGACDEFKLADTGGTFSLDEYENITLKGSIGKNTVKGDVTVALADAIDKNGDVEKYKSATFPAYKAKGTTVLYAVANNTSTQTIKPISGGGKPVLEYVITDAKGLPGKTCGAAVLGKLKNGTLKWSPFPGTAPVKGKTVTIAVYEAPAGFELPPKSIPLYFAVNCFT